MEARKLPARRSQISAKLPMWIIEHLWAHKMMDLKGLDPTSWPDMDSQPLTLEHSWRLRVVSARAYAIMKTRSVKHFERVLDFLESTYRLLPRLVPAIKHMKIMFGLKTMVIIWMLKEGRGMIDVVDKIRHFFPNKLPQYEDQCTQREMFLMRKSHKDFKSLAQTLALNKDKLQHYARHQMEEHYGERYAQKVEDRLLQYLHELDAALHGDTFVDKILKKHSPVSEEEKFILEVVNSDSLTIAATLRKLLHCDVVSCHPSGMSQSPTNELKGDEISQFPPLHGSPTDTGHKAEGISTSLSSGSSLNISKTQQPEPVDQRRGATEDEGTSVELGDCASQSSSPQFCSKHHRWVNSILQGCPDDCSEELLQQTNRSSSPMLFLSSSSTSSSQNLTPSNLTACSTDRPPSQPSASLQTFKPQTSFDETSSGCSERCQKGASPPLAPAEGPPRPTLLSPVVRLVDIFKSPSLSYPPSVEDSDTLCRKHVLFFCSNNVSSSCGASRNKVSVSVQTENQPMVKTSFGNQESPEHVNHRTQTKKAFFKLSQNIRRPCAYKPSQRLERKCSIEENETFPLSCSISSKGFYFSDPLHVSSSCYSIKSPRDIINQSSIHTIPKRPNRMVLRSKYPQCPIVSNSTCPRGLQKDQQVAAARLTELQPFVSLTRLSAKDCVQASKGRVLVKPLGHSSDEGTAREALETSDSSFDVNSLYSGSSSDSDCDAFDPEYRPHHLKKQLLLEYESAKAQHQMD